MSNRKKYGTQYCGTRVIEKFYGNTGMFIKLYDAILDSPAYEVLGPTSRCVLLDMFRVVRNKFRDIPPEAATQTSFTFTFDECRLNVSHNTFRKAMKELRRVGWVELKAEHQRDGVATPIQYTVSERWRDYRRSEKERADCYKRERVKDKQLRRDYEKKSGILGQKQIAGPKTGGRPSPIIGGRP